MCRLNISVGMLYETNKELVEKFGGCGVGFKDENLAISAIEGCNQEVFGMVLYPTILSKINHLVFSIVANHIFLDGNKRTGSAMLILLLDKYDIKYSIDFIQSYVISIASSKLTEEESLLMLQILEN
ncbi:MAG: type II toxin-antitoxin system death-on-curing family toxin [Sarcina sp.]